MKELFDFILVRLYYRLFVRPRSAIKAAPEWIIDLPGMKATYRGPAQDQGRNPLTGMTMTFYIAGDGEGGKTLCGGLDPIPATAQYALDSMPPPPPQTIPAPPHRRRRPCFQSGMGKRAHPL
jgi:hypothetical protein